MDGCDLGFFGCTMRLLETSGLKVAMKVLEGIDDIAICTLTGADVVRHRLVQRIIEAYEDFEKKSPTAAPAKKLPPKRYRKG